MEYCNHLFVAYAENPVFIRLLGENVSSLMFSRVFLHKSRVGKKIAMRPRPHKENYPAHLPPPGGPFFVIFCLVCLLGGSFLGYVPMDGLLHTFALTKRLGKQANIARARNVKLYFRLFRCANPLLCQCKVVNVVRNN